MIKHIPIKFVTKMRSMVVDYPSLQQCLPYSVIARNPSQFSGHPPATTSPHNEQLAAVYNNNEGVQDRNIRFH